MQIKRLLIVPYGIETCQLCAVPVRTELLIVPYGIETSYNDTWTRNQELLIVPYGIETRGRTTKYKQSTAFNRTLWN